MNEYTVKKIKEHAESAYPNECCGLVISDGDKPLYVPCNNASKNPGKFEIPGDEYAEAEERGQVLAIVHSHADWTAEPSEADRVSCELSGLPWIIVSVREGEARDVFRFEPSGYQAPLVGRHFHHGVLDCYSIIRDAFSRELGIEIPDFERADNWWKTDTELYLDKFHEAGFMRVSDGSVQAWDVPLMQYHSDRTNHAGLILPKNGTLKSQPLLHPVSGAMLHHVYGRLSERVIYGGHWADITRVVVRHARLIK